MISMTTRQRKVKVWLNSSREPVLQMSEPYDKPYMYVRDCYSEYYAYVKKVLASSYKRKYVSITGTPGTGKSMFYNWFFDKYRSENRDQIIVCASFSDQRHLKRCFSFEFGKDPVRHKEIPEIMGAMYLYDGPPVDAPEEERMVAFCSPNDDWFDLVRKRDEHVTLYMPVWEFDELVDADKCLGLGIGTPELTERFIFFGGLPRYCLKDADYTRNAKFEFRELLSDASKSVQSLDENSNWLFHYAPVYIDTIAADFPPTLPIHKKLIPCSKYIFRELITLLSNREDGHKSIEFLQGMLK